MNILSDLEGGRCLDVVSQDCSMAEVFPTLTEYQSFRVNGSCVRFFKPFFPFERRLFLPQC